VSRVGEYLPVQVLHDQVIRPVLLTDVVERADARVRQRRHGTSLAFESLTGGWVRRQVGWQYLDGDGAVEARVTGSMDLAHAACTSVTDYLVRAESGTGLEGHVGVRGLQLRYRATKLTVTKNSIQDCRLELARPHAKSSRNTARRRRRKA
jgi:hypothetical protein